MAEGFPPNFYGSEGGREPLLLLNMHTCTTLNAK